MLYHDYPDTTKTFPVVLICSKLQWPPTLSIAIYLDHFKDKQATLKAGVSANVYTPNNNILFSLLYCHI